jgi:hypothetical protein
MPDLGHNSRPAGIEAMLGEARRLAEDPRVVKSESGRVLTNFLLRLVETLADGQPSTVLPPRHHE